MRNINLPDTTSVQPVPGGKWMTWEDFMRLDQPNKLVHAIRFTEDDGINLAEWDADHGWHCYWSKTRDGASLSRCERTVRILGVTT